jgi:hypothetical protein
MRALVQRPLDFLFNFSSPALFQCSPPKEPFLKPALTKLSRTERRSARPALRQGINCQSATLRKVFEASYAPPELGIRKHLCGSVYNIYHI